MAKQWSLAIVVVYIIVLSIASLSHIGGVPELGSSFDDKIYHCIAYTILTLVLYNYFTTTKLKSKVLWAVLLAIIYGIIIEALQATLTDFRTPDYLDVVANSVGAFFAILLLRIKKSLKLK